MKSLSNLRGIGVSVSLYASENSGKFPFPEQRPDGNGTLLYWFWLTPPEEVNSLQIGDSLVWDMEGAWPAVMHSVAPWREHFETWLSPGHDFEPPYWPINAGFTVFQNYSVAGLYSNSFLGNPSLWSGSAQATESAIGPQAVSGVAHPSAKVLMWDVWRSYLNGRPTPSTLRPILFVDGSASARRGTDETEPVGNPLTEPLYPNAPRLYHDTPNGILGRDF